MVTSRQVAVALALAFCLGMAAQAQNTGRTVRHHRAVESGGSSAELAKAEAAIEKKDYATAQPLLKQIVAADAGNYQAWFDLGFVYNALGDAEGSIAAYRKSVAAKPDVFESNLNLGLMLMKSHQPGAEEFLRAATRLKPTAHVEEGQARAWLSLAHLLEDTKPEEAIQAYRQAATLQPKDVEPHLSAAVLLEKRNMQPDAKKEYKQAVALQPDSADALTGLANLYMHGRRFPEAEEILRKLVALRPQDGAARMQLGRMLAAMGKNDEAIAELESAAKVIPDDFDLNHDLADLYLAAGKLDQAEAQYSALVAAKPNDAELHHSLGLVLLKQHQFPQAQEEFKQAVKLKPDFGAAYGDLAVAASENKEYQLTILALDMRAKLMPELPVSYFLRATSYDHLQDYKHASENYHRFLEVANGKYPDQEWQARHRLIAIEPKKK